MSYPVGAVPNSVFKEVASSQSSGVQLADVVLWLVRREAEGKQLSRVAEEFLKRVKRNTEPYELSLSAMEATLGPTMAAMMSKNLSLERRFETEDMLKMIEARRQEEMRNYDVSSDK
jgi:hypothetical protein